MECSPRMIVACCSWRYIKHYHVVANPWIILDYVSQWSYTVSMTWMIISLDVWRQLFLDESHQFIWRRFTRFTILTLTLDTTKPHQRQTSRSLALWYCRCHYLAYWYSQLRHPLFCYQSPLLYDNSYIHDVSRVMRYYIKREIYIIVWSCMNRHNADFSSWLIVRHVLLHKWHFHIR